MSRDASVQDAIFAHLTGLGIAYDLVQHPPVQTIEDCAWAEHTLDAVVPKNLFLTPRNKSAYFLCITRPDAIFRTADVSKQAGSSRLSFGEEQPLIEMLRTYPGAISPMGLIFPEASKMHLLIDRQLRTMPRLAFHPNDSAQTLAMAGEDFFDVFLPSTAHEVNWIDI
ncbi:prolyl-tRNA synthetase associated domain-containing protein [Eubacteriales bacterium OttesenSCG-928-N13]|nr:prolyl-tRNA synthetase associated domain-containing protein [Eubacteriales bacterium OttesenSCG-928-N13]